MKKKTKKTKPLTRDQIKAKVREFVFEVDWFFDCAYWRRDLVWAGEEHPVVPDCNAEVTIDEKYQSVSIKIFPKFFKMNLKDQAETLVHELVHILLQPTKKASFDLMNGKVVTEERLLEINEEATSKITARFIALIEGRSKYMRDAYKQYIYGKK